MLSPQAMTDPLARARAVIDARGASVKPLLACWMGEQQVEPANRRFAERHLPYFPNPESWVEAFACLATHPRNQNLLAQVPTARVHNRRDQGRERSDPVRLGKWLREPGISRWHLLDEVGARRLGEDYHAPAR